MVITPLDLSTGTFARASAANLFDPAAQTIVGYAVDAARTQTRAATGLSDGVLATVNVEGATNVGPQCMDGTYVWAVADDGAGTYNDVWRCPVTSDPLQVASYSKVSTNIDAKNIWYLAAADLLLAAANVGGVGDCLYWSDDLGVTWTRCTLDAAPWAPTQTTCSFRGWELGQSTGGTYVIPQGVANGPVGSEPKLCRSTDGKSWTSVYTASSDRSGGVSNRHFHCVRYMAHYGSPTNGPRWITVLGDGKYNRGCVVSDNDGLTWTDLTATKGPAHNQPVDLYDYGDTRYMLAAADGEQGVYYYDAQTGRMLGPAGDYAGDLREAYGYVFCLAVVGGVYYACGYATSPADAVSSIWVSTDREHWTSYHQFAAGTGGCLRYVGMVGGKLLFGYVDDGNNYRDWRVFTISAAQVAAQEALYLEPTSTNVMSTVLAQCTSGWAATAPAVMSYPTDSPPFGAAYARITGEATDVAITAGAETTGLSLPDNTEYSVSALTRGMCGFIPEIIIYAIDAGGRNYEAVPRISERMRSSGRWCEAIWSPGTVPEGGTAVTKLKYESPVEPAYNASNEWEGHADWACLQGEQGVATSWIDPAVGGGVRADDQISWTVDLAAEWTVALDIRPRHPKVALDRAIQNYLHICSWVKGGATATLRYVVASATIELVYDSGGGAATLLTTAALDWTHRWHQFRLVVRAEETTTKLTLDYGTGVLHYASATPMTNLLGQTSATIQNGDTSQANQLPMLLVEGALFDKSSSDGEVDRLLTRPFLSPLWYEENDEIWL